MSAVLALIIGYAALSHYSASSPDKASGVAFCRSVREMEFLRSSSGRSPVEAGAGSRRRLPSSEPDQSHGIVMASH